MDLNHPRSLQVWLSRLLCCTRILVSFSLSSSNKHLSHRSLLPHSFVELTVAIIVCSAPGFTNFSRSYFPKLSSVLSRSKPSDSEDVLIESRDKYRSSSRTKSTGVAGELPLDHNRPYYELDDAWKHQRGATINQWYRIRTRFSS